MSYPGQSLAESYSSVEIQSVYSTARDDWRHKYEADWLDRYENTEIDTETTREKDLTQTQYMNWYDWAGKMIYWELCKELKLDHADKWWIPKPKSVRDDGTHKIL